MKGCGIGLLLAGIGLIIGSCVPLVQAVQSDPGVDPVLHVNVPPGGGSAPLENTESLTVVPVVNIESTPAAAATSPANVRYELSITNAGGAVAVQENGTAALEPPVAGAGSVPAALELRFPRVTLPAGQWTVRLGTTGTDLIRGARIRLLSPSVGPVGLLLTALVLAILGWLTASLGALQWIRSEAALPATGDTEGGRAEQERLWIMGCHLSAMSGYLLPFGHLIGPLAIWLAKRHAFAGVDRAGRSVLNFQLSATLYVLAGLMLSFFLIGVVVLFLVVVFHFSMVLYASLRAQRGLEVRYPLSMNFI